jgi:hypothetical protein
MSPALMITLLLVARDRLESSRDGFISAKQQHGQNDQQYEPDPATPIAKMGRHVAGLTAKERQHHEDKNNYE